MSTTNVKAFYSRLAADETFRERLSNVKSKAECTQIVQEAGYDFTIPEYEEYTAKLLEFGTEDTELSELTSKELESVFGGTSFLIKKHYFQLEYGAIDPNWKCDTVS